MLPLLCHLVPQVREEFSEGPHGSLGAVQLRLQGSQLQLPPLALAATHQGEGTEAREPVQVVGLDHGVHIALGAGELGGILDPHQHHEVEVVPHVVFALDVFLERDCLVVKG